MSTRLNSDAGKHLVLALAGKELLDSEREFLHRHTPAGVILFGRNIEHVTQVEKLIFAIMQGSSPPPLIWLDQEGGRVQRLRAPLTAFPSPWRLALLERTQPLVAAALAHEMGWLCGMELAALGVGVNCAPVLDIREAGADPVIGERAFGDTPAQVVRLATAWLSGFTDSGVIPVGKHFPGHGAARADSHLALPVVDKGRDALLAWELAPFQALMGRLPALMTAHLVAAGLDADAPATWSAPVLRQLLRAEWDYQGVVVSDALEMGALQGGMAERAQRAMEAGCDLVLCCTGKLADAEQTLVGIDRANRPERERQASAARIDALRPRRSAVGLAGLLADPLYRARRERVEGLAGEAQADPTDTRG